jgi:hypothetical protein
MADTIKKVVEVEVDVKSSEVTQLNKEIKTTNSNLKETNEATTGLTNQLDKMTGGAISGFKGVVSSVQKGVMAMKSLKVAIAATGIGLLIVAVGALTAAFRGSEEGQNKLAKIMGVIGVLTGNLVDLLADLGDIIIEAFENPQETIENFANAIKTNIINRITGLLNLLPSLGEAISLVFDGEFRAAGKVAANAVGQVVLGVENVTDKIKEAGDALVEFGKQNAEEARQGAQVADMRAKADKIERNLLVERSKLESQIAALRLKSRQEEEFSAEERKQALLDAQALEDSLLEQETEYLTLRAEAQIMENTFARSNKENLDAEANAIAAVNRMNAARLNQQRQTQRELNRVNKEIERDKKAKEAAEAARQKKAAAAEAARIKALIARQNLEDKISLQIMQEGIDKELMMSAQKYDALYAQAEGNAELQKQITEAQEAEQQAIQDKYAAAKKAADNKAAADQIALEREKQQQLEQLATDGLQAVSGATEFFLSKSKVNAKRQFQITKSLQLSLAIIDGVKAVTASLAASPVAIGPAPNPAGIASLAFAVLSSATAVAKIASAKYEPSGGGGGGGGASTSTPSIPSAGGGGSPQFNTVGTSGFNQVAGSIAEQNQEPVKAYVVSTDVTSQQSLDRNSRQKSSF